MADRALYTILGVKCDAPAADIREAYVRLAIAHGADAAAASNGTPSLSPRTNRNAPDAEGGSDSIELKGKDLDGSPADSNGGLVSTSTATDKLVQVQIAYEILSDDARRRIYDTYGDLGLLQLGSAPSGVSDVMQYAEAQVIMLGILTLVAIGLLSIVIFLIFLARKVDGSFGWSWYAVFVPLYIVAGVLAIISLFALWSVIAAFSPGEIIEGLPRLPVDYLKQFGDWSAAVFTLGWVGFAVTVSIGLQRREDAHNRGELEFRTNWWLYFIPCIISEGALLVSTIVGVPQLQNTLLRRGIARASTLDIHLLVLVDVVVKMSRVVGIFLICARVSASEGRMSRASWWVILIPYYCMFFFMILDAVFLAQLRRHSSTTVTGEINIGVVLDVRPRADGTFDDSESFHTASPHGGYGGHFWNGGYPPTSPYGNESAYTAGGGAGGGGATTARSPAAAHTRTATYDSMGTVSVGTPGGRTGLPSEFVGSSFMINNEGDTPHAEAASATVPPSATNGGGGGFGFGASKGHNHHAAVGASRTVAVIEGAEHTVTVPADADEQRELRQVKRREDSAHHPSVGFAFAAATLFAGLPFGTVLMIAARLQGHAGLTVNRCFIPLYIMLGASMCAALCVGWFLVAAAHTMEDDIHDMEGLAALYAADGEKSPASASVSASSMATSVVARQRYGSGSARYVAGDSSSSFPPRSSAAESGGSASAPFGAGSSSAYRRSASARHPMSGASY